jgi:hypothetical protein
VSPPVILPPGQNDISEKSDPSGLMYVGAPAVSSDKMASIWIEAGNRVLTAAGTKLTQITILPVSAPPTPSESQILILAYEFTPAGASFGSPVTLTLKYDLAQLPAGVDPSRLYVALWETSTNGWSSLPSTVDISNSSVTAKISRFSIYAIMAPRPAAPPSAPTPGPSPIPSLPPTAPPAPTSGPTPTPGDVPIATIVAPPTPSDVPIATIVATPTPAQPTGTPEPLPGASPTPSSALSPTQAQTTTLSVTSTAPPATNSEANLPIVAGGIMGSLFVAALAAVLFTRRNPK